MELSLCSARAGRAVHSALGFCTRSCLPCECARVRLRRTQQINRDASQADCLDRSCLSTAFCATSESTRFRSHARLRRNVTMNHALSRSHMVLLLIDNGTSSVRRRATAGAGSRDARGRADSNTLVAINIYYSNKIIIQVFTHEDCPSTLKNDDWTSPHRYIASLFQSRASDPMPQTRYE
ncbi:hypothetical protein EVAR_84292_1 [Eumeta japonica]|uniref:Uncharacterized protein n=1 Tax=Eumeta variegata TaxID=151549 RepID=A0A4C1WQP2_EUMVA|nr:hypothetical protein EVAR_84292_1 [Eumeta japonica]